jgi:hypothetical protein
MTKYGRSYTFSAMIISLKMEISKPAPFVLSCGGEAAGNFL